jgi:hypothetical protein
MPPTGVCLTWGFRFCLKATTAVQVCATLCPMKKMPIVALVASATGAALAPASYYVDIAQKPCFGTVWQGRAPLVAVELSNSERPPGIRYSGKRSTRVCID